MPVIQSISQGMPAGDRLNEDAYLVADDGRFITAAAIDGVTDRLVSEALQPLFESCAEEVNGSAYAAWMVRDAIMADLPVVPHEALRDANHRLRENIAHCYDGGYDPERIVAQEPALKPFADDPRYFRLVMPACVATLIRVDLDDRRLDYAHLGDTELLLFHTDGRTTRGVVHRRENAAQGLVDADDADPRVRKYRRNGLLHNYTDQSGNTDTTVGIGVLNGQHEAADYALTGTLGLDGVEGIVVCSDGFLWPAHSDETPAGESARLDSMRRRIERAGLGGYLDALRAEEATDPERTRYPRPKMHDDATAVYITGLK